MKSYESPQIRNVALAGHTASGKTSLTEAILWTLKQSDRLGRTDDGTTLSDYDPEEARRHCSIQASVIPAEHDGRKINLLDLPGFRDFVGEIKSGLRAAEAMLLVVDATGGVGTGAEFAWQYADEYNLPRAVFVNKLEKEHTSFQKTLDQVRSELGARLVPVTLPVGEALEFKGVVDLIRMKRVVEDGQKVTFEDIPADMADEVQAARAAMIEAAAEGDDELMMKFLEDEALTPEEILQGLRGAIAEGRIVPALGGSAATLKGIRPLLDFIAQCMPDPSQNRGYEYTMPGSEEVQTLKISPDGPVVLHIFKTIIDPYVGRMSFFKVLQGTVNGELPLRNVNQNKTEKFAHLLSCKGKKSEAIDKLAAGDIGAVAKIESCRTGDTLTDANAAPLTISPLATPKPTAFMAVTAKSRADEDKVGVGFHRLMEQDPTLNLYRDANIRQTILSGMGEMHLQTSVARLKDLAKVEAELEIPRVPYRETITKKGEGQGKHKKQSGGHGQYGDCHVRFEPLPEGSGFEFVWEVVGGVIPTNYKSAIEKGLIESLERGVLAGSPTVDIKAACYYGSYHEVDSSDMAFKIAASLAFKNVIPHCGPIILEPIYKATITVPEEYMGDVMGDLNGRRGRILGMNHSGKKQVIEAQVPLSELYTYSRQLNSLTQGRGVFEMEFDHYERVPGEVQEKIIAEAKRRKEEESE
ncbi:MAG: elongation factor G [bacterium]|nr:elongation factor G [bacterium]